MTWRLAYSLETLRNQINSKYPNRSKDSDGTIGDEAHASRTSDHNPWVISRDADGKDIGIVTALDITNDPRNGVDSEKIANALKESRDPRIKYVISNRKIWNPSILDEWRVYTGANPHDHHFHISVKSEPIFFDSKDQWSAISGYMEAPIASAPAVQELPLLKKGMEGIEVDSLRDRMLIALSNEKDFGPLLEGVVKGFQNANNLVVDGKVGHYTWEKLKQKGV